MKLYKIYLSEPDFVDRSTYEKYVAAESLEMVAKRFPNAEKIELIDTVFIIRE
ncbi:hypothetical protein ACT4R9_10045 [Ornithobacterium rhinotracheale]|uniref:hypothetical protein n=1 Tax=Ornithobacterium rhinotracheale TaxID=28251 RepID=UPI003FA40610